MLEFWRWRIWNWNKSQEPQKQSRPGLQEHWPWAQALSITQLSGYTRAIRRIVGTTRAKINKGRKGDMKSCINKWCSITWKVNHKTAKEIKTKITGVSLITVDIKRCCRSWVWVQHHFFHRSHYEKMGEDESWPFKKSCTDETIWRRIFCLCFVWTLETALLLRNKTQALELTKCPTDATGRK